MRTLAAGTVVAGGIASTIWVCGQCPWAARDASLPPPASVASCSAEKCQGDNIATPPTSPERTDSAQEQHGQAVEAADTMVSRQPTLEGVEAAQDDRDEAIDMLDNVPAPQRCRGLLPQVGEACIWQGESTKGEHATVNKSTPKASGQSGQPIGACHISHHDESKLPQLPQQQQKQLQADVLFENNDNRFPESKDRNDTGRDGHLDHSGAQKNSTSSELRDDLSSIEADAVADCDEHLVLPEQPALAERSDFSLHKAPSHTLAAVPMNTTVNALGKDDRCSSTSSSDSDNDYSECIDDGRPHGTPTVVPWYPIEDAPSSRRVGADMQVPFVHRPHASPFKPLDRG